MAGPVAHILCAFMILQSGVLTVTDKKAFFIGSCYPDIDYFGVIKRESTHYPNVRWEDVVAASTDFYKGILLHCLVDEVRIAQLEQPNEANLPALPIMRSQIMKFYEDSIIYNKIKNWPELMQHFNDIIPEEKSIDHLPEAALSSWHKFIQTYCAQQPSILSTYAIINQFPQLKARIPFGIPSLISKAYIGIAFKSFNKPRLTAAIKHFYDNCVSLITSNAHLVHRKIMIPT